jgi:exonuclease SbcD
MRILHTADWHIGHTFHQYDRTHEHQQFLHWLVNIIQEQSIDVLLISGDVFDMANPSAVSVKLLYTFLNNAIKIQPALQIIMTAGNHDSAARLESPKPLLESSNIHIIGLIERAADGTINYEKMMIPIKDATGAVKIWCMAIPFLRMGDYPLIPESTNPYGDGVTALYKQAYEHALTLKQPGQTIIAMGHLHTAGAQTTEHDKTERLIMGGVEFVPATAFHDDILYTALGHIHKAQRIGGKEHVRYSGTPIPMSFSESNYKHQVVTFEVADEQLQHLTVCEVPLTVALLRIPALPKPVAEVLTLLAALPETIAEDAAPAPYLEVRVLLDGPEPALRHKIETALTGKHARLAKIDVSYPGSNADDEAPLITYDQLHELQPMELFKKAYTTTYSNETPDELVDLFNQVVNEISSREN